VRKRSLKNTPLEHTKEGGAMATTFKDLQNFVPRISLQTQKSNDENSFEC
jgi:hypothetical protein